jgi:hypothetical protein
MGRWLALTLVAVAGVIMALWANEQTGRVRSALYDDSGDPKGLMVRGWADRTSVNPDETLRFDWTFENHTKAAVSVEIEDLHTPGFEVTTPPEPSFSVAPGKLKKLTLSLHPVSGGQFRLTGRYQSTSASGEVVEGRTTLGPVEVATPMLRFTGIARQAYLALKDLALPILLAFLAYFFQKRQKQRETNAEEAAKARETRAAQEREEREYRAQVRTLQLPRFQEYAEKHYLPIVNSLQLLQREFNNSGGDPGVMELYRLVLFLKRMQLLREERGGVFFQVLLAEKILQSAWFCFNAHVEKHLGAAERDGLLAMIGADASYGNFQKNFEKSHGHTQILDKLKAWVGLGADREKGGFASCLDLAHILQSVLAFEINRPLNRYWYEGKSDDLGLKDVAAYKIPTEPADHYTVLEKEIPVYRREVEDYIRKTEPQKQSELG